MEQCLYSGTRCISVTVWEYPDCYRGKLTVTSHPSPRRRVSGAAVASSISSPFSASRTASWTEELSCYLPGLSEMVVRRSPPPPKGASYRTQSSAPVAPGGTPGAMSTATDVLVSLTCAAGKSTHKLKGTLVYLCTNCQAAVQQKKVGEDRMT